jgi:lipid-A-disaccharide synthase-like uncharacterized protein
VKSFKWEPVALMALVIGLGIWIVWSSKARFLDGVKREPGARLAEFRVGNTRGVVEVLPAAPRTPGSERFRVHLRDGFMSEWIDAGMFQQLYGALAYDGLIQTSDNPLFKLFNITNWGSLVWVTLGLAGQGAFFGRMFIQWVASERRKESVVPPAFWWLSLVGGVLLFAYFIWRQDIVGVLGQSTGLVIYARNLRLIAKQKQREAEGGVAAGPTAAAAGMGR